MNSLKTLVFKYFSVTSFVILISLLSGCSTHKRGAAFSEPVKGVRYYRRLIEHFKNHNIKMPEYFPQADDNTYDLIGLSYSPGELQASTYMQLRCKVSPSVFDSLYTIYNEKKRYSFLGGNTSIHLNSESGIPTTSFYTNSHITNRSNLVFPNDYEILVFEASRKGDNHGKSVGVVLSKQRSEVIYYAEFW